MGDWIIVKGTPKKSRGRFVKHLISVTLCFLSVTGLHEIIHLIITFLDGVMLVIILELFLFFHIFSKNHIGISHN